jgi:uncharacterized membrane protein
MAERRLGSGRLEAFSDGVIAVIITIMVLELKVPESHTPSALLALWPTFLAYGLSYLMVAIYWLNHHNLFSYVHEVDTRILWANMLVLFSISFIPFATAFVGASELQSFPVALYGCVMLVCGIAFTALRWAVSRRVKDDPEILALRASAGRKNWASIAIYAVAIPAAFVHPAITLALTFVVALIYADPRLFVDRGPFRRPPPAA